MSLDLWPCEVYPPLLEVYPPASAAGVAAPSAANLLLRARLEHRAQPLHVRWSWSREADRIEHAATAALAARASWLWACCLLGLLCAVPIPRGVQGFRVLVAALTYRVGPWGK